MALCPMRSILTLFTLLIIILPTLQNSILDFEYSEYTQALNQNYKHNSDFDFTPTQILPDKLKFPQACNALDMLNGTI